MTTRALLTMPLASLSNGHRLLWALQTTIARQAPRCISPSPLSARKKLAEYFVAAPLPGCNPLLPAPSPQSAPYPQAAGHTLFLVSFFRDLHPFDAITHLIDCAGQLGQPLLQPDQQVEGHHHGKTVGRRQAGQLFHLQGLLSFIRSIR
jgi:hypothetical protein